MTERDRELTAFHESAHAAMAFTLRRPIRVVSIRPTQHYAGIASYVRGTADFGDVERYSILPVILWPAGVRRMFETGICISLAGPLGERLAGNMPSGYVVPSPDEAEAEAMSLALTGLAPREAAYLFELETATKPHTPDEEAAAEATDLLALDASAHYLSWMRAETTRIVYSSTYRRHVEALVPVLLERGAVSGRLARTIFTEGKTPERQIAIAAHPPFDEKG